MGKRRGTSSIAAGAALLGTALIGLVASACGGAEPAAPGVPATGRPAPRGGVPLPRARIVLDGPGATTLVAERGGARLHLDGRARIAVHADGRIERGRALLPRGQARAVELPARLGGGWAFAVVGSSGSQVFRAPGWTAELEPLVSTASVVDVEEPIVAGFDRLYVRIKSQNLLAPIDARTGASMPLGPLPVAGAHGNMVFADGWRAIVETDLRGLLATFDAGATWRALPPVPSVQRLAVVDGDPAVITAAGTWILRGDGHFTRDVAAPPAPPTAPSRAEPGPFGGNPLRAAIEDGWPDGEGTAVVARHGALARVRLADGATLFLDDDAFAEAEARCHALPLGRGIGFACGEPDRGTIIHQLVRGAAGEGAIAMREVMRFAKARKVVPSGNGALVIGGRCSDDDEDAGTDEGAVHCVRTAAGTTRELRLRGSAAAARLVALGDGRVAILVPPSADRQGQLTLLDGERPVHVALRFEDAAGDGASPTTKAGAGDEEPEADARAGLDPIVRGTWLEGLQEVEPGVLAGWIEAGGPVAGYRITLDGRVELGEVVEQDAALVAGPFGLAFDAGGRAMETTDFGRTWVEREIVAIDLDARDVARACGPAGCALPGALRVGWGEPASADDLAVAEEPTPLPVSVDRLAQRPLSLACAVVSGPHEGSAARPAATAAPPAAPPRARRADRAAPALPGPDAPEAPATPNGWQPLRGVAAPPLGDGEVGFDAGQPFEQVALRAYAWGTRAGWGRTGRWLARFDDRFDARGIRTTRPTSTPWATETAAGEAFGVGSYSYATTWAASMDLGGRHAVVSGCTGRPCALYLAEDGGALVPLRDAEGLGFARPIGPAAQVGRSTWFLGLAAQPSPAGDTTYLHRAEGGVVSRMAPLRRPGPPRWAAPQPVRLARRARSEQVGLVTTAFAGPNDRRGRLVVVPVAADGTFGEPVDLGRTDLADRQVRRCTPGDDGWLLELSVDRPPALVDLGAAPGDGKARAVPRVGSVEARVRLDPGSFCVESLAGTVDGPLPRAATAGDAGGPAATRVPLAVTHRTTGERWGVACNPKP